MVANFLEKIFTFFFQCIGYGYYFLSHRIRFFIGYMIGFLFYIFSYRKKVIQENLEKAFPDTNKKIPLSLIYTHLGQLVGEMFLLFGPCKKFLSQNVLLQGESFFQEAKSKKKGVIFLSSHLGNWEIMAAKGGGLPDAQLLLVTKKLKPLWFHQAMEKVRKKNKVEGTYEPHTLKDIFKRLKKNGCVGFVMDQYAGPPVSVRVPFFGVLVGTSLGLATVVKRTGAIVLPVESYRTAQGGFVVNIQKPLEWIEQPHQETEIQDNTAAYVKKIEEMIRAHPEQWLWTHRRFKGDLSAEKSD